ncbi:twin-arginine translocase subunit TatC [Archaeoglobales archaeon]|mgnify:CR=1 FL=1|nr:MAG: twin-arginine translocase subunit TatC [Archaeoglobales archaeon]
MEPPEDREMELREHLSELRKRTLRILVVIIAGMVVVFPFSSNLIKGFWEGLFMKKLDMIIYTPTEWIVTQLVFSFILVIFVTYPFLVYEFYQFAKPGLFEHERKFVKTFLPFSYLLFLLGTGLAYFIVIPKLYSWAVVPYFGAEPHLSVKRTLYGAFKIFFAFGLTFQIPVVALISVRLGLIDSEWLKGKRLIVYIAIFILATNITFDISGISQIVILALVAVMYELSIFLAKLMEKPKSSKSKISEHQTGS